MSYNIKNNNDNLSVNTSKEIQLGLALKIEYYICFHFLYTSVSGTKTLNILFERQTYICLILLLL